MTTSSRLLLAALLATTAAPTTTAQELIAIDFAGQLFGVDPATGQSRDLGPSGLTGCNAMADVDGTLYVNARAGLRHRLVAVDPVDYSTTVVNANLGLDVRALAFRSLTTLHAIVNLPDNSDVLYRIDVATGQPTLVGPTGRSGIQALEPFAGRLYAWDVTAGLLEIDSTTGAASDGNPLIGTLGADVQFLAAIDGRLLGGNHTLYELRVDTGLPLAIGTGGYVDLRGGTQHFGRIEAFGASCPSSTFLNAFGKAMPGTSVTYSTAGHAPDAAGLLHIGTSQANAPFPGSPCALLVDTEQLLAVTMNASGVQKFQLPLPTTFGLTLHTQLVTLAPVPGGVIATNGITIRIPD